MSMKKTAMNAQPGQPTGDLTCCGSPMKPVGSGAYECTRCDCWVTSDDGVIEKVSRCSRH